MSILVYVDNNIITSKDNRTELEKMIRDGHIIIGLSLYNIKEIVEHENVTEVAEKSAFIDRVRPVWFRDPIRVQRDEIQHFMRIVARGEAPDVEYYYQMLGSTLREAGIRRQCTIYELIAELQRDLKNETFNTRMERANEAALDFSCKSDSRRVRSTRKGLFKWRLEHKINFTVPKPPLPYTGDANDALIAYIVRNKEQFLAACPCLRVEEEFADLREDDRTAPVKKGDAIDGMHAMVALASADIFITNDTATCHYARSAKNRGATSTVILRSVSELRSHIDQDDERTIRP